jgi:Mn2+/Fe2+ NRAMP family transporter
MFSTMLTVLDGYPRVLTAGCRLAWPGVEKLNRKLYGLFMIIMMGGALLIYKYFTSHMRTLVDFATTLAFLSAPLFAYLNYRVISMGNLPTEAIPPRWLRILTWIGLIFLTCFSIVFLIVHFGYS